MSRGDRPEVALAGPEHDGHDVHADFVDEARGKHLATDVAGVEVGGAVKNVLAIATGMLDGMAAAGEPGAPGLNARAALITRGLAEMTRLGLALGARPETFMGLSGLGDLVLTATGDLSRNRKVGLLLAGLGCALGLQQPDVVPQALGLARQRCEPSGST